MFPTFAFYSPIDGILLLPGRVVKIGEKPSVHAIFLAFSPSDARCVPGRIAYDSEWLNSRTSLL
jgi:hypothetical protein